MILMIENIRVEETYQAKLVEEEKFRAALAKLPGHPASKKLAKQQKAEKKPTIDERKAELRKQEELLKVGNL